MRRFWKLVGLTIQARMYYRIGFLLSLLTPLVLLGGQFLLWRALYAQEGAALAGYTRADMFTYILIAFAMNNLLTWTSENVLSREIRSGTVIARRIRPVSFLTQTLSDLLGNMLLQGVVNTLIVGLIFALFSSQFSMPSPTSLLLFAVSLALGMLLRMLLVSCFSLLCFFTTSHLGLTWTRTALTDFLSGALIPVALFPAWLQTVSYASPFPLMLQVPVALFLGRALPMAVPLTFALQIAWSLVFFGLHQLLYGYIRKNATLAGG